MTAVARPNGDTSVANPMSLCSVCQGKIKSFKRNYSENCFFKWAIPGLFLYLRLFNTVDSKQYSM